MKYNDNDWKPAVDCKAIGSWNLHSNLPSGMDFFVMLASASGLAGLRGQTNYNAGNTYEDALARFRVSKREKTISLYLGAMTDDSILAENPKLLDRVLGYNTLEPFPAKNDFPFSTTTAIQIYHYCHLRRVKLPLDSVLVGIVVWRALILADNRCCTL